MGDLSLLRFGRSTAAPQRRPVGRGGEAGELLETPIETRDGLKAGRECDLRDAAVRVADQLLGLGHPQPGHELPERQAGQLPKSFAEILSAVVHLSGHDRHREFIADVVRQILLGQLQPTRVEVAIGHQMSFQFRRCQSEEQADQPHMLPPAPAPQFRHPLATDNHRHAEHRVGRGDRFEGQPDPRCLPEGSPELPPNRPVLQCQIRSHAHCHQGVTGDAEGNLSKNWKIPAAQSTDARMTPATRITLLQRLKDVDDQRSWQEFFDTYHRLIHTVARKAGLTEAEAQDAVQETVIAVAKKIPGFEYVQGRDSFKGWLLQITRWKVTDQFRKRLPVSPPEPTATGTGTSFIGRVPDPAPNVLEAVWQAEWDNHLLRTALQRVKRQVATEHYRVFRLYVVENQPAPQVAEAMGVSVDQVYLIKHRVTQLVKKELQSLESATI